VEGFQKKNNDPISAILLENIFEQIKKEEFKHLYLNIVIRAFLSATLMITLGSVLINSFLI
jgi:hypothetical protein